MGADAAPIFILGGMRTGTTLLRLILNVHPHIAVGHETYFARSVADAVVVPGWAHGVTWLDAYDRSAPDLLAHLAGAWDRFFSDSARSQGKVRWGEKTPAHMGYIDLLAAMYPRAVFVGILRHPGAVAHSLSKWGYATERSLTIWQRNVAILKSAARRFPGRVHVFRYEDLVMHPEPTLRRVMAALDEPWSDRLLDHGDIYARGSTRVEAEGGTVKTDAIDSTRLRAWLSLSPPPVLAALDALDELEDLGYASREVLPVGPLGELFTAGAPGLGCEAKSAPPLLVRLSAKALEPDAIVDAVWMLRDAFEDRVLVRVVGRYEQALPSALHFVPGVSVSGPVAQGVRIGGTLTLNGIAAISRRAAHRLRDQVAAGTSFHIDHGPFTVGHYAGHTAATPRRVTARDLGLAVDLRNVLRQRKDKVRSVTRGWFERAMRPAGRGK